ncbi:hypothetical protein MBLNU459_g8073t1 [Dothideomycetes sp. NU459]
MTPNAARLLQRYGIDKHIGSNLTSFSELNLRRRDGTPVGFTPISRIESALKHPWWLVHRHHLHTGLVLGARDRGVRIHVNSRVSKISQQQQQQQQQQHGGPSRVRVETEAGTGHDFDLLIGADGVGSIVRRTLFPDLRPSAPTLNCAYRAIVPYEEIRKHADLRPLIEKPTMEVWMAEGAYVISYPISGGTDLNIVLSHHVNKRTEGVEDVEMEEVRRQYAGFDPRIRKIVDMIPGVQRWPLLVTEPLESWSSAEKNVVLMGDAAHSMAQGAATSMEDGAFLGTVLSYVVQNKLSLADAIGIYERSRMPLADAKQQVSFLNGVIWHLPDGPQQEARDAAMSPELRGEPLLRSPNLYGDPVTVLSVYGYDAQEHAEREVRKYMNEQMEWRDCQGVTVRKSAEVIEWFLPDSKRSRL